MELSHVSPPRPINAARLKNSDCLARQPAARAAQVVERPQMGCGGTESFGKSGDISRDLREELDLMYDPMLNCYYDPGTNKYYELK